jgi:hypothetical protein
MRDIQNVTSGELLAIQAMRKNVIISKNTYIFNLLLNLVTPGIKALIIPGNKFLYVCVQEVCRL